MGTHMRSVEWCRFQSSRVTRVTSISWSRSYLGGLDALDVLCAQLTRDVLAIAKFLSVSG